MGINHESCYCTLLGGTTRATAASKMELLLILVSGFHLLTNATKNFILDFVEILDPSVVVYIDRNNIATTWHSG